MIWACLQRDVDQGHTALEIFTCDFCEWREEGEKRRQEKGKRGREREREKERAERERGDARNIPPLAMCCLVRLAALGMPIVC